MTFAGKPMLVIVYAVGGSNKMLGLVLVRGANQTYNNRGTSLDTIYISWGANSVSWYEKYDAEYQANKYGTAYAYVALLLNHPIKHDTQRKVGVSIHRIWVKPY